MSDATGLQCAVVGNPAAHSLSPSLYRAAFAELGLDWSYRAIDLAPEELDSFVEGLGGSWRGLSVTMPHKEAIRRHGTGDELVELVGAANTWVRDGSEAIVRNTDVGGFLRALAECGITSADSATVIGNGATARSAVVALRELGVERVVILARNPERAKPLRTFCSHQLGMLAAVRPLETGQVLESDLLVSTVPGGGADHLAEELTASAPVLFDCIYDPWPTALASAAERAGATVLNGLDLLAGQAVDQVRLITGGEVGFQRLWTAGHEELLRRVSASQ